MNRSPRKREAFAADEMLRAVLEVIAPTERLKPSQIAERCGVGRMTVQRTLRRAVEAGLIASESSRPQTRYFRTDG